MHTCKNCGETDLSKFGLHSTSKKPHGYCRKCRNERHKVKSKEYLSTDKGRTMKALSDKKYYETNKDKLLEYNKEYRDNNSEELKLKKKEYYNKYRQDILDKCKIYKKSHKHNVNKLCAKRRASKLKASLDWGEFNTFVIEEMYDLAKLRSESTGIKWHVDHIVPLNNTKVQGLHVWTNLQVIPGIENLRKSNKIL